MMIGGWWWSWRTESESPREPFPALSLSSADPSLLMVSPMGKCRTGMCLAPSAARTDPLETFNVKGMRGFGMPRDRQSGTN